MLLPLQGHDRSLLVFIFSLRGSQHLPSLQASRVQVRGSGGRNAIAHVLWGWEAIRHLLLLLLLIVIVAVAAAEFQH